MSEKNPVLSTLLALTGDRNTITLHVRVVDFCNGDIETALFLEQMLYWTPRSSNDGWVSKSAAEWYDEIRISRYAIDKAVKLFHIGDDKKPAGELPFLQTKLKKFNGSPTIHYKLDTEKLAILWSEWLESTNGFDENSKTNLSKSANPPAENSKSLTESTSKTTTKRKQSSIPSRSQLIKDAFAKHWKLTLTLSWKSHLEFLKWAVDEVQMTPAMIEFARNTFDSDEEFNWKGKRNVSLPMIQENWLILTSGYQETSHQSQPRELTRDDVVDLGGI